MAELASGSREARVVAVLEVLTSILLAVMYLDALTAGGLRRRIEWWWDRLEARGAEATWTPGAEAVIREAERITRETSGDGQEAG